MDGYNCTVFAYGQTGTGKTHTMEGDLTCADNAGIVPRSVKAIFEQLGESNVEFAIRVSFLELYNEELQDLLSNDSEKKLRLCEDVKKGLICQNLEEIPVLNVNDIFDILQRGIKLRQTAETACNKNSSRSHSIFTMKMFIKESNIDGEEVVRHGQLNLVDLAGSECVGRSGAKNDRAREAGSINQSLLTLGRVITALVDHHGHVPYRDSKLTRLLQESLGGRAKTCIIATLSPSMLAVEETLSTLDYAYRAKNIKNAPQQNQKLVKAVHLQEYSAEIETLRAQLQITREKNGIYLSPADFYAMESRISGLGLQMIECESMIKLRNEEAKASKIAYELLETQMRGVTSELEATSLELKTTKRELSDCQHKLCEVQGELRVSEAVVADKILLESRLRHEGEILQGEVRRCRESIDRLHDKVESYAANEERLIASGQSFVSTLTSEEQRLSNTIKIMLSGSNTCAASISSNITELLVSGKRTCNELNLAVNSALAVLVSQGNTLQLEVGGNLSGLQSHLTQSTADTIQKLQDLQTEVHLSLKHLEERMERSQALLLQHQTQVSGLVVEVREGVSRMSQISSEYSVTQRKHIEEMLVSMVERRSEIERKLAAQEAAMLKERELEVESMRSKAAIIEEVLRIFYSESNWN